jgi:hypothetical protein
MNRTLLALIAGAVAGAGASLYWTSLERAGRPTPVRATPLPSVATERSPRARAAGRAPTRTAVSITAQRAETYQVAVAADRATLAGLIASAATEPWSAAREFRLAVLLQRYSEIAPQAAIDTARTIGSPAARIADLYAAWAATDSPHALAALGDITNAAEARAVASAVLVALGNDEAALDEVLGALPAAKETDLRIASVAALAESALDDALAAAVRLDDEIVRGLALQRVAIAWARKDVQEALAAAEAIGAEELRRPFRSAVIAEWMRLDPDATLEYLATLPPDGQNDLMRSNGFGEIRRADPRRTLAMVERFPASMRESLTAFAIQSYVAADPLAAIAYVQALPPGQQRQQLLSMVAMGYARKDPDAALNWARSVVPPQPGLLAQVLGGIALKNPNRAIDEALALPLQQDRMTALRSIAMSAASPARGANTLVVADRVLAIEDRPLRDVTLQVFVGMWGSQAPADALTWMLTKGDRVPMNAYGNIAERFGQSDPIRAASYTARIPDAARPAWIQGVASGYARQDPRAALTWIEQFRGEPAFDVGVSAVVQGLAQADPVGAAELLASVPKAVNDDGRATYAVAAAWAQKDPPAAAEWALDLAAGPIRDAALRQVTDFWANQDLQAARGWALRLPTGGARDAALGQILAATGAYEAPDAALLSAFSDARARERGVAAAMWNIAARDPNEARALIDRYVTDPAVRRQAENAIQQSGRRPMNVPFIR